MTEYREVNGTIRVPQNTGSEGFLHTIRQLLKKPRLQKIVVDARGTVSFTRYAIDSEEESVKDGNYGIDFSGLEPYGVIRNARIQEFVPPMGLTAPVVVGLMFDKVAQDKLRPLAFATGSNTSLWDWYRYSTGHVFVAKEEFFGLPVLYDRQIPDSVLLLSAGYGRDAAFIDTQISYKVQMPEYTLPSTEVEIIP